MGGKARQIVRHLPRVERAAKRFRDANERLCGLGRFVLLFVQAGVLQRQGGLFSETACKLPLVLGERRTRLAIHERHGTEDLLAAVQRGDEQAVIAELLQERR